MSGEKTEYQLVNNFIKICSPIVSPSSVHLALRLKVRGIINNTAHNFIIDTSFTSSINNVKNVKITEINVIKLIIANGSNLELLGTIDLIMKFKNFDFPIQCIAVQNLIGHNF